MKTAIRKISLSFALVIALLLGMTAVPVAAVTDLGFAGKITDELRNVLDVLNDGDRVTVYIWTLGIDYEQVEDEVERSTGFNRRSFSTGQGGRTRAERSEASRNVDRYIRESRDNARRKYDAGHRSFEKNHLGSVGIIFQSQYAPMIISEVTKADVYRLEKLEQVTSLSLYVESEEIDDGCLNISLPSIGALHTRDTFGLRGEGVIIGMTEDGTPIDGVPDLNYNNISRLGTDRTPHAALVAAIMVGNRGLAPNAALVSNAGSIFVNVETLLSHGVNVINMSASFATQGRYDDRNKWFDHIANQHNVTFVKSAGNEEDEFVGSPGTAYNLITVGNIDDRGTVSAHDDRFRASSSYGTEDGRNKPEVVAPGVGFSIPGYTASGTSFSAPHVTGIVAQMMQARPELKIQPELVKAMIMASCDRKVLGANGLPDPGEPFGQLTPKQGAGVVNAANAVLAGGYAGTLAPDANVYEIFIPLTAGVESSVVLSWLMRQQATSNHNSGTVMNPNLQLTDLDMEIYDSNGVLAASSYHRANNNEYVRFTPDSTGLYKVRVIRYTENATAERFGIAYTGTTLVSPAIVTHPANHDTWEGRSHSFTVAAISNPEPAFQWQVSADSGVTWLDISGATGSMLTLSNLTMTMSGNRYRCIAVNSLGSAVSDAAMLTVSPPGIPYAITNLTATLGNNWVDLNWTAPNDNGSAIIRYQFRRCNGTGILGGWQNTQGASTNHRISGLSIGISYSFQVRAVNSVGFGIESNIVTAMPATVPAAITDLTLTRESDTANVRRVTLSWTAPDSRGSPITGYRYSVMTQQNGSWGGWENLSGVSTTRTITAPSWSNYLAFKVIAVNAIGPAADSNRVSTLYIPQAVTDVTAIPGNGQVTLNWTAPNDGGSPITGYRYRMRTGTGSWGIWLDLEGTGTSHTVTGLVNGTTYQFWVLAVSAVGVGVSSGGSTIVTATPMAPNYGDVDGDGVIDAADITLLRRYIAAEDKKAFLDANPRFSSDNADVNGDGVIDANDVALLRRYVAGFISLMNY